MTEVRSQKSDDGRQIVEGRLPHSHFQILFSIDIIRTSTYKIPVKNDT